MLAHQHGLRRRLRVLEQALRARKSIEPAAVEQLAADIDRSRAQRERRERLLPRPTYPQHLPVVEKREDIARAIAENQVIVLCGETGSGKTTQLPKICLELGRGVAGMIGHTQPRRIAARSVASRIAQEFQSELGHAVGYKVRFSDRLSPDTYVKLMTDGILLAETQGDRLLEAYDTLIIDEAHERSLNIDFLLGYLKQLLPRRPDLKLIITSATIDPARFSRHFGNAPIVQVSGRTYPVEVRYRPLLTEDEDERDRDMQEAILEAVDELSCVGPGDILVFLAGEREIRETAESLRKHHPRHTEILPLYARLSAAEQEKVFQPSQQRRIVLATNVAETSLTVPGIRYVIDPGYARISRYSPRVKVQRLPIEKVSRASADQRKGRCGRVAAGVCIRLYSQEDYLARAEYTDPEILRTHLAWVILQMRALRLGEIEDFPFVEPPDSRMVKDGYQTLMELGALDEWRELTPVGRELAKLPVDPRIGRMVLAGRNEGCLTEILIIASGLSVQDPRERPMDAREAADQAHQAYADERSDFLSYLKLWEAFTDAEKHLSKSKLRQWCHERYLSYVRIREWQDIHQQLHVLVSDMGFRFNQVPAQYHEIHGALLTGLLSNVAFKTDPYEYTGARNSKLAIFPGSALFKRGPKWIVAAELVETTKLYARTVAQIEPEWVERLAAHLIKRSYFEPHWEKDSAQVTAYERIILFGLTLVARRKVNYGPINPQEAREIFIRSALAQWDYRTDIPFYQHNRMLLEEIEALEHKSRRRDVLVDEEELYRFYDARIPQGVYSGPTFERWRKEAESQDPKLLFLTRGYLMRHGAEGVTPAQFPDTLTVNDVQFPLEYHFEPGDPLDGVTLTLPLAALNQISSVRPDWLVPGLLREKVIALLRSLPKSLRRSFVPAPEYAEACVQALKPANKPLTEALAEQLFRITGVNIPADAWHPETLPDHLCMNFKVVDEAGKTLALGRDLEALKQGLGGQARTSFRKIPSAGGFERQGITAWNFGSLPEQVEVQQNGLSLRGYPALVDDGNSVSLRLFDSPAATREQMRAGLRRLFMLQSPQQIKSLQKSLPITREMCLQYLSIASSQQAKPGTAGGCEELKQELLSAVVDRAFIGDEPFPRDAAAFERHRQAGLSQLLPTAQEMGRLIGQVLAEYHAITRQLSTLASVYAGAVSDVREQLAHLVYPGFVSRTPSTWLQHLPRYLKAIRLRLEKLRDAPAKDAQKVAEVRPLWQDYLQRRAKHERQGITDPALEQYRWMLEELRVSLFAQEIKTAFPVSVKRIQRQWEAVQA
jgi:ATP-dependent helicase HrpA